MRVLFVYIILLLIASPLYAETIGEAEDRPTHGFYGGLIILPFETSGLEDIDASDWQNYGLLSQNPSSLEGRVSLPLSKGLTSGLHPGVALGFSEEVAGLVPVFVEVQYASAGGASVIGAFLGTDIKLYRDFKYEFFERFSIGLAPKVGYVLGKIDFGAVKLIPGYTPPVITPEGTFNTGDSISANVSGPAVQGAMTVMYGFTESFALHAQAGYTHAFLGDMKVVAGDVDLKMDSPVLVKNDGSATQAGIDPQARMSGIMLMLGGIYRF